MKVGRNVRSKAGRAVALVAAVAAAWAVRDYAKWKALGPGGLPANARGWLSMARFRWMAKDQLDVGPVAAMAGAPDDMRAWTHLQARPGMRPAISPYPIPHRQLDQLPEAAVRAALSTLFDAAVSKHADRVEYALSHFEKRHPAITLKKSAGLVGARSWGEIAHIHPSDNSMHMILSPTDAIAAIEAGWAQRHGLAGIAAGLPVTYVMIYAPRDEGDLAVIGELLEAAIVYATQADCSASVNQLEPLCCEA